MSLTARQAQLLRFIDGRLTATGVCPTYEEMLPAMGLRSKSGINRLVCSLERRGYIRRIAARHRAIQVVKADEQTVRDELVSALKLARGLLSKTAYQRDLDRVDAALARAAA